MANDKLVHDTIKYDLNTEIVKRNALCRIYDVENREQRGVTYRIKDWKELNVTIKEDLEYEIFADNYAIRKNRREKY